MAPLRGPVALLAVLLLAACATYDPAHAPCVSTTGRAFAERIQGMPIDNVARLDDAVWRGAWPDEAGLRALHDRGVKTIVNLHAPDEVSRRQAEAMGLRVVDIPLHASLTCTAPQEREVKRFLDVVNDPANRPVYVHCRQGRDRTGTMCAIYRMETCGWTADEAIEEMHAFGYHDWYRDFIAFVRGYKCHGGAEKAP